MNAKLRLFGDVLDNLTMCACVFILSWFTPLNEGEAKKDFILGSNWRMTVYGDGL